MWYRMLCVQCSPPFNIHWYISSSRGPGGSGGDIVNTSTVANESVCYYDIQHQFHQPGNYVLAVFIDNGLSRDHVYYSLLVDPLRSGKLLKQLQLS